MWVHGRDAADHRVFVGTDYCDVLRAGAGGPLHVATVSTGGAAGLSDAPPNVHPAPQAGTCD
eukprot:gene17560-55194_t